MKIHYMMEYIHPTIEIGKLALLRDPAFEELFVSLIRSEELFDNEQITSSFALSCCILLLCLFHK